MDLNLTVNRIEISPDNGRMVGVSIEGVESDDVLSHFNLKDIIYYFGEDDLLDQIGQTKAIEYFDLQEKE